MKFTVTPGMGEPSESVMVKVISPVSWMPEPLRPSTEGVNAVAMMEAGPPRTGSVMMTCDPVIQAVMCARPCTALPVKVNVTFP